MSPSQLDQQMDQMAWRTPQARSVPLPKRLPLVNRLQSRSPTISPEKDARLVNCYAEYDPQDQAYWVYKRFGISSTPIYTGANISYGRGAALCSGANAQPIYVQLWAAQETDGKLHLWDESNDLGALSSNVPFGLVDIIPVVSAGYMAVVNPWGVGVYATAATAELYLVTSAVTLTTVVTPSAPVSIAYLDGYVFYMDALGNIYNSNENDPSTWNALNVIKASAAPSIGVAVASHLSYIIAFTDLTAQVFYDAGNPTGSVLSPVPEAQLPVGCFFKDSLASIDNELFWLTYNETGAIQVGRLSNLSYQTVSSPPVERYLTRLYRPSGNAAGANDWIYGWSLKLSGHRFYGITSVAANFTLVYDIDQQLWYQWTDANGNYWPITTVVARDLGSAALPSELSGQYVQLLNNGSLSRLGDQYDYATDYGNVVPVDIYTPNFDAGTTRRKYLRTMYIDGDKVPARLKIRHSDDDYNTWSNFREVDLSLKKPRLSRCGSFDRRRAYHFRHQAPTTFRMRDVDLQMDLGTL